MESMLAFVHFVFSRITSTEIDLRVKKCGLMFIIIYCNYLLWPGGNSGRSSSPGVGQPTNVSYLVAFVKSVLLLTVAKAHTKSFVCVNEM